LSDTVDEFGCAFRVEADQDDDDGQHSQQEQCLHGNPSPLGHSGCLFALFAGLFAEMFANIRLARPRARLRA